MGWVTAIVSGVVASGRYSLWSSMGIAGSALRDGSTIFSKGTSEGECRSVSSVSRRGHRQPRILRRSNVLLACRLRLSARN